MNIAFTTTEIATIVGSTNLTGRTSSMIRGVASLKQAMPGDLSFLSSGRYKDQVTLSRASLVLVPPDFLGSPSDDQCYLVVPNPSVALAQVCLRIEHLLEPQAYPGVHASTCVATSAQVPISASIGPLCVIEDDVKLGERVRLHAHVFVGRGAVLGDDCHIMPGCIIAAHCELGDRVRLQSGVVIGSEGFGYEFHQGRHKKIPQIGIVKIGNDVEIGANSTLDRARFSQTLVGEGTKIDNLVQIAHNVEIGRHCLICAQVGISGSTVIEDFVVIGGQAGIAGHLVVHRGAKIDGQTGVNSDLNAGVFVKGSPCLPYQLEQRINVLRRRLPDLFKRVDRLEAQFGEATAEKTSA
jgi:UDP-3-O-[3-hydroxymyristoyl] glucosamine N-acyltransferase